MNIHGIPPMNLIKLLYEGRIIPDHRPTRILADRAVSTGDYGPLRQYLSRHPIIFRQAQQNREIIKLIYIEQTEMNNKLNKICLQRANKHEQ